MLGLLNMPNRLTSRSRKAKFYLQIDSEAKCHRQGAVAGNIAWSDEVHCAHNSQCRETGDVRKEVL